MKRRPLSIAGIGVLFIVIGAFGTMRALWSALDPSTRVPGELYPMAISGAAAVIGGAFVLRGQSWARWVLIAWMAAHVVISAMHSGIETLVHVALFAPLTFLLLRRRANNWFRRAPPTNDARG